ncbi:MAG: DUF362 domain-containing protein [Spirochaetes bacterium]|nr:DUF362 domain-containing protein [Spirochaetota bacterium]
MSKKVSDVYFIDMRAKSGNNIFDKIKNLILSAGFNNLDLDKKFTALKIHFGEPGNYSYVRPVFVSIISKLVKTQGGIPFLTDTNTMYTGQRANAADHLETAEKHGFLSVVTGCPVIIADGLRGTEYKNVEINLKYCKSAKIGAVIADSDVIISINHFKGHDMTGFGGALKNIGMGCGSRAGKREMHSDALPAIDKAKCNSCGRCVEACAAKAMELVATNTQSDPKAHIIGEICTGCGQCIAVCNNKAVRIGRNKDVNIVINKIAEYSYAVLKDKKHFHITFIMDVSPNCDCWSHNDAPIVPNIGVLASFDPVAIDLAAVDLVNAAPGISGSLLDKAGCKPGEDKFLALYPKSDWRAGIEYAASLGLGNCKYKLIKVD